MEPLEPGQLQHLGWNMRQHQTAEVERFRARLSADRDAAQRFSPARLRRPAAITLRPIRRLPTRVREHRRNHSKCPYKTPRQVSLLSVASSNGDERTSRMSYPAHGHGDSVRSPLYLSTTFPTIPSR